MPWTGTEAESFVICLFKRQAGSEGASSQFINDFERTIRGRGGNIQLRSDKPQNWEVIDGREHLIEPNHLNPAIFDITGIVLAAFRTSEECNQWWTSEEIFQLLKHRDAMAKMGFFTIEGLLPSFDNSDRDKLAFGDKLILFEFMKMSAFKPIQQYVDDYKRCAELASKELGTECNLVFAEGITNVLMSEFPLDAACASSWRMRTDAHLWYDADFYQEGLVPLRKDYAKCLTLLVPIFQDRVDDLEKAKTQVGHKTTLAKAFQRL